MYNEASLTAVRKSAFSKHFRAPHYGAYSFAHLPGTFEQILTGSSDLPVLPADVFGSLQRRSRNVIAFFVDAFGWAFFERYRDRFPLLQSVVERGSVSLLTSQFPSTTAAHVTTIHTGLPVSASGVFEWFYFEPRVDKVIAPLLFSYAGDSEREMLAKDGYNPAELFPAYTLHHRLAKKGVSSTLFQSRSYSHTSYSGVVFDGADVRPYKKLADGLDELTAMLLAGEKTGYFFVYADAIDLAGHNSGPASKQFDIVANRVFETIEERLVQPLADKNTDTLLAIFADHGQTDVSSDRVFYINREIPEFEHYLRRNKKGQPILFAGSSRDLFLYIEPAKVTEVMELLKTCLAGKAEVYSLDELIDAGIFQPAARSAPLQPRIGNVVILPYAGEQVSWFEQGRFECSFKGHHGGLTPVEMEIPLLLLPL